MFSLFNFSSLFPGGQLTPFAPMCGRPCKHRRCTSTLLARITARSARCRILLRTSSVISVLVCLYVGYDRQPCENG